MLDVDCRSYVDQRLSGPFRAPQATEALTSLPNRGSLR